jgi:DNA (cytosine-5)-methyltransferase 1
VRLLDLFCGAGGAAVGYHRAGFDTIVGVDIKPQPRYPFQFVQADALEFCKSFGAGFDVIHASPPCQHYSVSIVNRYASKRQDYPDLLPSTRMVLERCGRRYVIENVVGAPIRPDLVLCGSQFSLKVARHRLFELNWPGFLLTPPCAHAEDIVGCYGTGTSSWIRRKRIAKGLKPHHAKAEQQAAMGLFHTSAEELCQAIPPAYTEFIGKQLLEQLR